MFTLLLLCLCSLPLAGILEGGTSRWTVPAAHQCWVPWLMWENAGWIKNGVIWVDTVYSISLTRLELPHVYPISASWFPGLLIVLSNNYSSAKLGSKYNAGIGVASCVSGWQQMNRTIFNSSIAVSSIQPVEFLDVANSIWPEKKVFLWYSWHSWLSQGIVNQVLVACGMVYYIIQCRFHSQQSLQDWLACLIMLLYKSHDTV